MATLALAVACQLCVANASASCDPRLFAATERYDLTPRPTAVAIAGLTGDGRNDVVVAQNPFLALGHVDGDGRTDVLVADGGIEIFLQGSARLAAAPAFTEPTNAWEVEVSDLDGDATAISSSTPRTGSSRRSTTGLPSACSGSAIAASTWGSET